MTRSNAREGGGWSGLVRSGLRLLTGSLFSVILAFVAAGVAARYLGVSDYGVLVYLQAFTIVIGRSFKFQTWQPLIKYGTEALQEADHAKFARLTSMMLRLDLLTALLATLVALALLRPALSLAEIAEGGLIAGAFYCATIATTILGAPTGLLRLMDRFDWIAYHQVAAALLKLLVVVAAMILRASPAATIIAWAASEAIANLGLLGIAIVFYRRAGYPALTWWGIPRRAAAREFSGSWSYLWSSNFNGVLRMAYTELDVVIIGAVLGTAATGLYRIAKLLGGAAGRIVDPFYQTIYPNLAKAWAQRKIPEFRSLLRNAMFLGATIAVPVFLILALGGRYLLRIGFGPEFVAAYPVLVFYMVGVSIAVITFALQPAVLSVGKPRMTTIANASAAALYFACLFVGLNVLGIVGAGIAYASFFVVWSLIMAWAVARALARAPHRVGGADA